jgi:predicted dehydrogenase
MIRFGLFGAGRIGKIHGGNIAAAEGAKLVAIADMDAKAAAALARSTGASVRSLDEIVAAKDIDAVLIGTPTDTHADLIERSVRAGKAVFCEKPVDLDARRIEKCLKVVEASKMPLMIGFNRRFDPNFASLKERLVKGAVGNVEMVTIISRDPAPPPVSYIARSGGLYRDMMIHDFDIARFLLGEEPVEVHAVGSVMVDKADGVGPPLPDLQFAPRRLWLRPEDRGPWLGRHAACRQHPGDHRRGGGEGRLHPRQGAELLPRALRAGLSARNRALRRGGVEGEGAVALRL